MDCYKKLKVDIVVFGDNYSMQRHFKVKGKVKVARSHEVQTQDMSQLMSSNILVIKVKVER